MGETVTVVYETRSGVIRGAWVDGRLDLPAWCSGDPATAVALYLYGYGDARADVRNARVIGAPHGSAGVPVGCTPCGGMGLRTREDWRVCETCGGSGRHGQAGVPAGDLT